MTDHSPDHAERTAQKMLADRGRFPSGGEVPFDVALSLIAAALRGRDAVVEWEVWQDDMPVASSTSEADARHYLMVYGQDGPATLMRVERAEIARAGSSGPANAPNSPGDRP